jgi:hypothetical protein
MKSYIVNKNPMSLKAINICVFDDKIISVFADVVKSSTPVALAATEAGLFHPAEGNNGMHVLRYRLVNVMDY